MVSNANPERASRLSTFKAWIIRAATALTAHSHLHAPEPVGMFAGSLLARSSWDHP